MVSPGNIIGPGKIVQLKSATIVQIDPLRGGLVQAFILLRSTLEVPGKVRLDVTDNQGHSRRVTPTQNPVQRGSTISDHSVISPDRVRLTGRITDTPLGLGRLQTVFDPLTGRSRSVSEVEKLREIQNARDLVFLATSVSYYEDMIITDVQITKTTETGKALELAIDLQQLRIVGPEIGAVTPDLDSILGSSGSTDVVAGGTQVAEVFG